MNIFLATIALILNLALSFIGVAWEIIRNILKPKNINKYFKDVAVSLDQLGNVVCRQMLNDCLVKGSDKLFGNPDETISSVLGKNKEQNTLTKLGKMLANFLNLLEKNHVEKSIEK